MTELQIRSAVNGYAELEKIAREVSIAVADIRNTVQYRATADCYTGFKVNDDTVEAYFEEPRCSCCSPDYHSIEFPISYLWQEDFAEQDKKSQEALAEAERILREVAEAEEIRRREEAQETRDRANYERLKKKYENP